MYFSLDIGACEMQLVISEFNNDQRRELVNTRQRFDSWSEAAARERSYRGSMVWEEVKGRPYLIRASYDEHGKRRNKSLGPQTPETQAIKDRFDSERAEAIERRKAVETVLNRQAAVNRALGLGRIPLLSAKIVRALDKRGLLGVGLIVVGTNALFAYEAMCGVVLDASIMATGDIDLLFDARRHLHLLGDEEFQSRELLDVLRTTDRSFVKMNRTYSAENDEGFMVDLIKPMRNPPWLPENTSIGGADDLTAADIEGLVWLENAPRITQMVLDERGMPLRIVVPDPRVFAIHKYWVSRREERNRLKKVRDVDQARTIMALVKEHLPQLPLDADEFRMLPRTVVEEALAALA